MDDSREVGHDDIMCRFNEANELLGLPKAFLVNICVSSWKPKLSFHAGLVLFRINLYYRQGVAPTSKNKKHSWLRLGRLGPEISEPSAQKFWIQKFKKVHPGLERHASDITNTIFCAIP